ncbi:MAG TPA: glycosyl hydrolase family 65 protein [Ilumatobacteraceae bacterium]|nr:glycosyl hydrolase family 65 protein [Ilumatobacteraceae bacterium]
MKAHATPTELLQHRFPVDPWRLVEREYSTADLGVTETLFATANGYIGMRANPDEGRRAHSHVTLLNGFHETWPIQHAEDAFAFAKTGQTIVNVPDAKLVKLYVDDEPLQLETADISSYERSIDFRHGELVRSFLWHTPSGKRVGITSTRLVSLVHRHLAVIEYRLTLHDAAPVVVSSELLNRQDLPDDSMSVAAAGMDPRKSRAFGRRVLLPRHHSIHGGQALLAYQCANSGMTMACGYEHLVQTTCEHTVEHTADPDQAKTIISLRAEAGDTVRIVKFIAYHSSGSRSAGGTAGGTGNSGDSTPPSELAHRCTWTIQRAVDDGIDRIRAEQSQWLADFWDRSDIRIDGDPPAQQAMRWNLFQLAQACARSHEGGIAAKAVTGAGYEGHYFWDTEIYIVPFLSYTSPEMARRLVRFRWHMLDAARQRARELNQRGALYPWRTINGEEASAYYAAGTAQYHINAAVALALKRYLDASGDMGFLATEGAEILVETARMWEDLGFWATNGSRQFHIHGVTGPDEYTTVVNNNLYTNVMARFNMRYASRVVESLQEWNAEAYADLARRVQLEPGEPDRWTEASEAMFLPFDETLGFHPQDDSFLQREPWDFANTPLDKYPLLLHFHPLVIYRFQVLKQADVVLAMVLRSDQFTLDQKRRNFDYYDPITTGDSSLSACVQAMAASQIGYEGHAVDYFRRALFVDLADTHGNTADGVHIASAGGVWGSVVFGFAGLYDSGVSLQFQPRLPREWPAMSFRLQRHGVRMHVELDNDGCTVSVLGEGAVPIETPAGVVEIDADNPIRIDTTPLPV